MSTDTKALRDVLAERKRQIEVEGWTPEHDDEHSDGSLALAASVYANRDFWDVVGCWPWPGGPKFKDRRSDLVRAGALILAEIERMDRANTIREASINRALRRAINSASAVPEQR